MIGIGHCLVGEMQVWIEIVPKLCEQNMAIEASQELTDLHCRALECNLESMVVNEFVDIKLFENVECLVHCK